MCYYFLCRRGVKHFDVNFWPIRPVLFLSKDKKDAVCEKRNGRRGVYFPPESASFVFMDNMIEVLFPICTLNWRVNNYVSHRGKSINTRNESTSIIIQVCNLLLLYSFFWNHELFAFHQTFSLITEEISTFVTNLKTSQSSQLTQFFPSESSQNWGIRGNCRRFQEKHQKIRGTMNHKTHLIREWLKSTSSRFLKKLKGGSLKNFAKNSTGQSHAFWVLCLNLMNFFWTHKFGRVP